MNRYHHKSVDLRRRARRQIDRELALIEKLELPGYFLIVWDIVDFCRRQNILVQGRGSAANSAVCYALGITAIDPVEMELLFERFLSEERGEWPDIDLDLPSGDQRERAIQYVYERYGKLGAAMTANIITYRGRSAVRDIGKVLGFPETDLARISALVPSWGWTDPKETAERQFTEAGFSPQKHPLIGKFLDLYMTIQDLPRHLGQHSGGMVICEGQLDSIVPLEPATMPGRVVIQWDKEDCADMGIIKVDLLGLGMMAVLEESIQLIRTAYREEVDLAHLPQDDPLVYQALQKRRHHRNVSSGKPRADVVPASPAARAILRHRGAGGHHPARPHRWSDAEPVSAAPAGPRAGRVPASIARAGASPDIGRSFISRAVAPHGDDRGRIFGRRSRRTAPRHGIQALGSPHARHRDPAARWHDAQRHHRQAAGRIVQSITAFALYGFPESHAASFALIAYASAYLKCRYLAAFTAAILNNQPMGFYAPATLVKDAQRHGLHFNPIDVTRSDWLCTIEEENGERRVRLGLNYVKGTARATRPSDPGRTSASAL